MDLKSDKVQFQFILNTPVGKINIAHNSKEIISLQFINDTLDNQIYKIDNQLYNIISHQLKKYFQKQLYTFTLPLNPKGTAFQKRVWDELIKIPFGTTCTYQELAKKIGGKEKTRAVAQAISKNPILILIPCHRILGTNGKLTGFSGGLNKKKSLLELEGIEINE